MRKQEFTIGTGDILYKRAYASLENVEQYEIKDVRISFYIGGTKTIFKVRYSGCDPETGKGDYHYHGIKEMYLSDILSMSDTYEKALKDITIIDEEYED